MNFNGGETLERCLVAVEAQTRPPDKIILVDNASTDGSLEPIEQRWAHIDILRLAENVGFAAANNRALELCEGFDFVALLNPDAYPEPGWLEALMSAASEQPEAGSFASCMLMADDPSLLDGAGDAYHVSGLVWRIGHGSPRPAERAGREVFAACAAAALYRYEAVRSVGAFDESYFCYNEDVDLGFRLRLAGRPCWYVPDAVALHVGSAVTGRHSDFSLFYGHRNLVWTFVKNMPRSLLLRFLWQHLLLNILTTIVLSLRHRTFAVARAKWAAVLGLPRILRRRREVQAPHRVENTKILESMVQGWWRCYAGRRSID